jgi:hypothetical protein
MSAAAAGLLLLLVASASPTARGALSAAEQTALLAKHNALRAAQSQPCTATDMRKLAWDSQLAAVAQAYADTCVWAHNGNRQADAGYPVGENLCASGLLPSQLMSMIKRRCLPAACCCCLLTVPAGRGWEILPCCRDGQRHDTDGDASGGRCPELVR